MFFLRFGFRGTGVVAGNSMTSRGRRHQDRPAQHSQYGTQLSNGIAYRRWAKGVEIVPSSSFPVGGRTTISVELLVNNLGWTKDVSSIE